MFERLAKFSKLILSICVSVIVVDSVEEKEKKTVKTVIWKEVMKNTITYFIN